MVRMNFKETTFVSLNSILLAIFYTLLGVLVSFILYHLFDSFDDTWKEDRNTLFQLTDVSLEIGILSVIAFWSAHIIDLAPPFFPVRKKLDSLVDGYISGIFYVFAIFVFMDELTSKLKYLFEKLFGRHFGKLFPAYGSIIDMSLSYKPLPRKTKVKKNSSVEHQDGV
jgi:hypothetical protein